MEPLVSRGDPVPNDDSGGLKPIEQRCHRGLKLSALLLGISFSRAGYEKEWLILI